MDELFGFEQIRESLLKNFNDNKLHHGLLFLGNKGIGKSSFAFDFARYIIKKSSDQKQQHKDSNFNSHPDLLIIQKDEKKRDITVDAVREINQFLSLTSAISKHRIVIIDAIDDLNKNSSNAILKILEEPPKNVFLLLINHNQAKLLDTIKSRCQLIVVNNPKYEFFQNSMQQKISTIQESEIRLLSQISNNSIGLALKMHNHNVVNLYAEIQKVILEKNDKNIIVFAKKISLHDEMWDIFEKIIFFYFYNLLNTSSKNSCEENKNILLNKIFIILDKVNYLISNTKTLNLDRSQSIINIFNIIKNV